MDRIIKITFYSICGLNLIFAISSLIPFKDNYEITFTNPVISANTSIKSPIVLNAQTINDEKIYNILLLGLDGRRGDSKPRCDAIHIFSYSPVTPNLIITSIPRGTAITRQNLSSQSAYLANNCSVNGINDTISEIEVISGIQIDAYITVGFSQVMGILRTIEVPTTSTLQYLRNRKYVIGDNQRSHNQALFLKDMIINHFEQIYKMPKATRAFLYKSIDTNLSFDTFEYLANKFRESKIHENPSKIITVTKPERNLYVKEFHIDFQKAESESQLQDTDFIIYQKEINSYLSNIIRQGESKLAANQIESIYNLVRIPFKQKLWLQIEDINSRDEIQFRMIKLALSSAKSKEEKLQILNDYYEELETFGRSEYIGKISELEDIVSE